GLSNPHTVDYILDFMKKRSSDFLCLLETKTISPRLHYFYAKLNHSWEWVVIPSNGFLGGILVHWKHSVGSVTPVVVSRWALHLVIPTKGMTWIQSTIYNSQVISDHKNLWKPLLYSPWLLNGDFNAITGPEKHWGGDFSNYSSKANLFSKFIFDNNLHDLGFSRVCFTWCNA
ncbi:DNase I-like protein, partial [Dioscorea alata]